MAARFKKFRTKKQAFRAIEVTSTCLARLETLTGENVLRVQAARGLLEDLLDEARCRVAQKGWSRTGRIEE